MVAEHRKGKDVEMKLTHDIELEWRKFREMEVRGPTALRATSSPPPTRLPTRRSPPFAPCPAPRQPKRCAAAI